MILKATEEKRMKSVGFRAGSVIGW